MKRMTLLLMLGAAGVSVLLSGCNSAPAAPTAQQAASFRGGPMPPEARAKMAAAMEAAKAKRP